MNNILSKRNKKVLHIFLMTLSSIFISNCTKNASNTSLMGQIIGGNYEHCKDYKKETIKSPIFDPYFQLTQRVSSTSFSFNKAYIEYLLDNIPDVNKPDNHGNTLLHFAAYNGHREIIEILLSRGANKSALNKNYITPLMLAEANGHNHFIELLSLDVFDRSAKKPESVSLDIYLDKCSICLDQFKTEDSIVVLPCSVHHRFHKDCIVKCINTGNKICPICRQLISEDFIKKDKLCSQYFFKKILEMVIIPFSNYNDYHRMY
ncbi:hypothetical protein CCPUN_04020 [Cardinium endosymbiont of Culicoides punctatus]|nr:hypothetical protein CCPUN_04020 [Cardinium endosymbiont of Culicoides punctatus]